MTTTELLLTTTVNGTVELTKNSSHHSRTEHFDVHHHFVREAVKNRQVSVLKKSTEFMVADVSTKPCLNVLTQRETTMVYNEDGAGAQSHASSWGVGDQCRMSIKEDNQIENKRRKRLNIVKSLQRRYKGNVIIKGPHVIFEQLNHNNLTFEEIIMDYARHLNKEEESQNVTASKLICLPDYPTIVTNGEDFGMYSSQF
ncbi:unnamed protein product [Nezara viridula]|uniref:Uncharacterized protein n=1 Tax=Nezara viridula TaxID=85310 RepID=A0A9P0H4L0_NEZVI|nr:unnamed protein product [Nezara viridula]